MPAEALGAIDDRAAPDAVQYDAAVDAARRTPVSPRVAVGARGEGLHVLYLVHDLNDPSVRRRVLMLQAGGAKVTLAGFSRKANPLARIEGVMPIDLGRTHDGRFIQRLASVGRTAWTLSRRISGIAKPDVVVARNLETLALARRAAALLGGRLPIVYECLDIHRLMLRTDVTGRLLRSAERWLGSKAAMLVTSSPAFIENYFERFRQFEGRIELVENKVLELDGGPAAEALTPTPPSNGKEPWKIGWFGALRCRRSLDILSSFARRMEGRYEIVLRGRPAYDQFDDFERRVAAEPFVSFQGPYKNPEDLARIYSEVHFSWLVDFFEEGLNSNWLLPNRLYEGCRYATVPIAVERTETGRFLDRKRMGVILSGDTEAALCKQLSEFDADRYANAVKAVATENPKTWLADRSDCIAFVDRLAELSARADTAL